MVFWYKIADDAQQLPWQPNGLCSVTVLGKPRILARVANTCKAFAAACPHTGAPLLDGTLTARGEVVCPEHHRGDGGRAPRARNKTNREDSFADSKHHFDVRQLRRSNT
jgi:phenylpropionate dioxygenase-like ring-hydroxylating dioxygenase large terminal subunit